MRRVVETGIAVLVLVVSFPVITVVAILILVTMGAPVLFRQERPGLHGTPFTMLKFRTMTGVPSVDDDSRTDLQRVTPVGRALRASSVDELPQLWNVVRGEMSLIGPRPTLPEQVALYSAHERGRLAIRPGLTGWAQVNGRNSLSWSERIELDLWYVANRSLAVDVKIVVKTVGVLVGRQGVVGADGVNPEFTPPTPRAPIDAVTAPDDDAVPSAAPHRASKGQAC